MSLVLFVTCEYCVVLMLVAVFTQWEADHGPASAWQLIEPVDGFHPNQVRNITVLTLCLAETAILRNQLYTQQALSPRLIICSCSISVHTLQARS